MKRHLGLALVAALVAATSSAAAPVAPTAAQSSRGADGCTQQEADAELPPGTHTFALTSAVTGGGNVGFGGMDLDVTYDAAVELVVGDAGKVDSATGTVTVDIGGRLTGVPGAAGNLAGTATGTLALATQSATEIVLEGDVAGLGALEFSGSVNESFAGDGTERDRLTLRLDGASCFGAGGAATSSLVDGTISGLQAAGLSGSATPMSWMLGEAASPEATEIRAELQAIEQIGTAGPDRRAATARLGKALAKIKSLPDDLGPCLFKEWQVTATRVLEKRVQADLAVVQGLQPSNDLGPLYGAVGTLIESERQYQTIGLDECTEERRWPTFEVMSDVIGRFADLAIEQGRVVDVLRLMQGYTVLGGSSERLAQRSLRMVSDHIRALTKQTMTLLDRRSTSGEDGDPAVCSDADRQAVRKAIVTVKQYSFVAANADDVPTLEQILDLGAKLGCQAQS